MTDSSLRRRRVRVLAVGDSVEEIDSRLGRIAMRLSEAIPDATISTGVTEHLPQDTVEVLIDRATRRCIAKRRNDRSRVSHE